MVRADRAALTALGFEEAELRALSLWDAPVGPPDTLAEAYVRRSKQSDDLTTLRGHVRDIVRRAKQDGITIRHVWFEQRSASKAHVKREEFDKATQAVIDGLSKTFYIQKTDRLSRRGMGHVGAVLDEFEKRAARIISVSEGIDSSKGGRSIFAFLSERARDEAKEITERTQGGVNAHKAEGKWPGGVTPYGLMSPRGSGVLVRNNDEYPTARRIAEMLLDGMTPAKIAFQLNEEKVPTRKGKKWRDQTVHSLAHSPSWAGLIPMRERQTDEFGAPIDKYHRGGQPLFGPDGHPVSCGEGVITFAERERILAILASRSVPGTAYGDRSRGKREAAAILTGILRCGICNGVIANAGKSYRCRSRIVQGPAVCKGAGTLRSRVDDVVAEMWKTHILTLPPESPTIHEIARRWLKYQDPATETRKTAVMAALDNAASRELRLQKEFFIGGNMAESAYDTLRGELAAQIASLKAELAELSKTADLTPLMSAESLTALWDTQQVAGKRALLAAALEYIVLKPAAYIGDKSPVEARLVPQWRDEPAEDVIDAALRNVELFRRRRQRPL